MYISHKCDNLLLLLLSLLKGHVQYVHWTRVATNIHTYINTYMIHYHWPNMNVYTIISIYYYYYLLSFTAE